MDASPRSDVQGPSPAHATEPASDSPAAKRRRRDSTDLRQRVTRACDRCKKRKVRCTGVRPCEHCLDAGTPCTYDLAYARGRLPAIPAAGTGGAAGNDGQSPSPSSLYASYGGGGMLASPVPTERSAVIRDPTVADAVPVDQRGQQRPHPPPTTEGLSFLSAAAAEMDRRTGDTAAFPLAAAPAAAPSPRVSPEPLQMDRQGHYVGPASGVSFLLRVQKRLHDNASSSQQPSSSIFTFGDAPLPPAAVQTHDELDTLDAAGSARDAPMLFLTQPAASRLLARYFDFAVPTHRFLHRPTVESWLHTFYATRGRMTTPHGGGGGGGGSGAQTAVLFMVFAHARDHLSAASVGVDMDSSAHYYRAAERQLAREKGAVRLASVQARLCQCFYLLSHSRINHCWSLFGTTAHLALAIGLNRNRRADPAAGLGHIDVECRRRTFWCAYSLDTYLSAALGRPRTFHDEDIDQALPSIADDDDIRHGAILGQTHPRAAPGLALHAAYAGGGGRRGSAPRGMSVMLASDAHMRLSQIASTILRDLYAIRPISSATRAALTVQHSAALRAWRHDDARLARFLDADHVSASLLIPLFQRQRNVLNLAYWHAMLLTHRPVLLSNFAYLRQGAGAGAGAGGRRGGEHDDSPGSSGPMDARDPDVRAQAEASIAQCLEAAMHIIEIVDNLFQHGQLFPAYWFTMYFAFSAVVVVYVYVIQHQSAPHATYRTFLAAAVACQGQIARLAEHGSLTQRYSLVLEELRLVTLQHAEPCQPTAEAPRMGTHGLPNRAGGSPPSDALPNDRSATHAAPQQPQQQQQQQPLPQQSALDLSSAPLAGGLAGGLAEGPADWASSGSSSLADVTSWGYFDSMVSSGFWPLDSLVGDDHQVRM